MIPCDAIVSVHAAGWEHVYDFLDHIFGCPGKYGGIGMHLGHYKTHADFMTSMTQTDATKGFFNAKYWVRFITAGVALWLQSLEPATHSPCCELNHIGGDGTGIGISMNEVLTLPPIWQPTNMLSNQPIPWGRLDRCSIPSPSELPGIQRKGIAAAKKCCKELLTNNSFRDENRSELLDHRKFLPPPIYDEMTRWIGNMNQNSMEWVVLKRILLACVSDESILGIITKHIAAELPDTLALVNPSIKRAATADIQQRLWNKLYTIKQHGMGDDIACLMKLQMKENDNYKIAITTWHLLQYLRE
jgi:hypothetical protein